MARQIDFDQPLSEEDAAYVAQRPWLKRDAELQGATVRLASDEPIEPTPTPAVTPQIIPLAGTDVEDLTGDEDADEDIDDETGDEDEEPDEDDEEDEDGVDYSELSNEELEDLIRTRNKERDADHIRPATRKKADLIAALQADDE